MNSKLSHITDYNFKLVDIIKKYLSLFEAPVFRHSLLGNNLKISLYYTFL
jgi:hypothetical protein